MEYKDYERYTHDWVTPLAEFQLAYNTSQHYTTGKSPPLVEEVWNPLFPVDHLNKNLLNINSTVNQLGEMWKRACDIVEKCLSEAGE
ncbi:hypothetical protein O181_098469 [Austropuccinia psidii MF-1]|uniref:Uncharacterized protein n=1 Tax=Austropuccinia psidii MF-1 TaxID=1389203 RepID=A0A9Q3PEJ8_9BASI|nr:hypothetical protein [Austropuccinia psidii MF-1]